MCYVFKAYIILSMFLPCLLCVWKIKKTPSIHTFLVNERLVSDFLLNHFSPHFLVTGSHNWGQCFTDRSFEGGNSALQRPHVALAQGITVSALLCIVLQLLCHHPTPQLNQIVISLQKIGLTDTMICYLQFLTTCI